MVIRCISVLLMSVLSHSKAAARSKFSTGQCVLQLIHIVVVAPCLITVISTATSEMEKLWNSLTVHLIQVGINYEWFSGCYRHFCLGVYNVLH